MVIAFKGGMMGRKTICPGGTVKTSFMIEKCQFEFLKVEAERVAAETLAFVTPSALIRNAISLAYPESKNFSKKRKASKKKEQ
jgi:hypothetical protein